MHHGIYSSDSSRIHAGAVRMPHFSATRLLPVLLMLLAQFAFTACNAHYPSNAPLDHFDPHAGYRFENVPPNPATENDLFIILAFSGGGTRAAAFSYGVMEKLHTTPITLRGKDTNLLEQVDVISSASGGSFTAAYY